MGYDHREIHWEKIICFKSTKAIQMKRKLSNGSRERKLDQDGKISSHSWDSTWQWKWAQTKFNQSCDTYVPCRSPYGAGSQSAELRPWQRSWGRRLGIRKGGIEPQESPWKFSSIYSQNQCLPTLLLCVLTYTSDFTGGCPPPPLSEKELT